MLEPKNYYDPDPYGVAVFRITGKRNAMAQRVFHAADIFIARHCPGLHVVSTSRPETAAKSTREN